MGRSFSIWVTWAALAPSGTGKPLVWDQVLSGIAMYFTMSPNLMSFAPTLSSKASMVGHGVGVTPVGKLIYGQVRAAIWSTCAGSAGALAGGSLPAYGPRSPSVIPAPEHAVEMNVTEKCLSDCSSCRAALAGPDR